VYSLRTYNGLPASPGIVIARAKKYIPVNLLDLVPANCASTNLPAEVSKINHALMEARKQLESMRIFYAEKELINALEYIVESIAQEALELINNERICSVLAVKKSLREIR